jgi:dTMP kinase
MFITIEGGEGAGKSTLIQGLREYFSSIGREIVVTREPGGTAIGERIREWLLHGRETITPMAELQLFLAVRAQHLNEVIEPALVRGDVLLCDRYNDSSIAYQGYGRGLGADVVATLCDLATSGRSPDLTFYLDLPPREGLNRLGEARDRIESEEMDFHNRVRNGFLAQADKEPERICVVDARKPKEAVLAEAIVKVAGKLQASV